MEKIKYINGNGRKFFKELPKILIKSEFINDVWFDNVYKTSKLNLRKIIGAITKQSRIKLNR